MWFRIIYLNVSGLKVGTNDTNDKVRQDKIYFELERHIT